MNIIRLYNQNRKELFIVLLIVIFIIVAIHFVNYLVEKKDEKISSGEISSSNTESVTATYGAQKSAISSSTVTNIVYKKQSELISEFMKYCNNGNSIEAYNLISSDCKNIMFPTIENFENNYLKKIFVNNKLYTIKNWAGDTYKINIIDNILETGTNNNGVAIEDYYTIITEGNTEKLNINGFIGRKNKNISATKDNINIQVIYEDTYRDYVVHTLKVKNNTDKTIFLDSGENTKSIYVTDNNNVKYMAYRNEIINAELRVFPQAENIIQIKSSSAYIASKKLRTLVLSDVILDYDLYLESSNIKDYKNRNKILIEL